MVSLVIFGGVIQSSVASIIGWSHPLLVFFATLRWVIIAAAMFVALAMAYRFGPNANVRFRLISAGSITAVLMTALASLAFQLYVAKFGNYASTYGGLAAMIILMLWTFMAAIALLIGCEVNKMLQIR